MINVDLEGLEETMKEIYIIITVVAYLTVFPCLSICCEGDMYWRVIFFMFGAWWSYMLGSAVWIAILKVLHLFLYFFSSYFKILTEVEKRKYPKLY